jgi:hypothetical protein
VVITNDETLTAEDVALAYKGGAIIESCFRRMKQTGLEVRPMFHWRARRIEAYVKLCVLALQMQRSAEIRTGLPWARIAHRLSGLKAVRYGSESRRIVQRTKIAGELADLLKKLGIPIPKQLLAVTEAATTSAPAWIHAPNLSHASHCYGSQIPPVCPGTANPGTTEAALMNSTRAV